MITNQLLQARASLLQSAAVSARLVYVPQRGYLPYHQKKYDKYFKPQYFDNVQRTPDTLGKLKYNT